jgi:hypothetical protein
VSIAPALRARRAQKEGGLPRYAVTVEETTFDALWSRETSGSDDESSSIAATSGEQRAAAKETKYKIQIW